MSNEKIEIEVSSKDVAYEVAVAITGRAGDIHRNPDDEYEWMAEELKEIGKELRDEYRQ